MVVDVAGGLEFTVMAAEEYCCGAPLWRTGQIEAARKLVEHNLDVLRRQGIKTLITSCAECYGTFRGLYPRIADVDFKVLHITEVMKLPWLKGILYPLGSHKTHCLFSGNSPS